MLAFGSNWCACLVFGQLIHIISGAADFSNLLFEITKMVLHMSPLFAIFSPPIFLLIPISEFHISGLPEVRKVKIRH